MHRHGRDEARPGVGLCVRTSGEAICTSGILIKGSYLWVHDWAHSGSPETCSCLCAYVFLDGGFLALIWCAKRPPNSALVGIKILNIGWKTSLLST